MQLFSLCDAEYAADSRNIGSQEPLSSSFEESNLVLYLSFDISWTVFLHNCQLKQISLVQLIPCQWALQNKDSFPRT